MRGSSSLSKAYEDPAFLACAAMQWLAWSLQDRERTVVKR